RKVRLRPAAHLDQLRNRSRFAISDKREKPSICRRQQPDHGIDGIEARFGGIGRRPSLAARDRLHLLAQRPETLNVVLRHLDLRVSSTLTTIVAIPRSARIRSTSSKKSSINASAFLNSYGRPDRF